MSPDTLGSDDMGLEANLGGRSLMKRIAIFFSLLILVVVVGAVGCSDSTAPADQAGSGEIRLFLVDAPGDFEQVNIVVTGVQVHRAGEDSLAGWFTVSADTDTIDLLDYADGESFVLADSSVTAGAYTQIRLMIGEGCTVVVDGQTHPLIVPSGMQTGLKIVHGFTVIEDGLFEATLDFDAERSVHVTGNDQYMLKPVVRMVDHHDAGAIIGLVDPAASFVMTTAGEDTVICYADDVTGAWRLPMLPAGLYDVTIQPLLDAYLDSVVVGVEVTAGLTTDLGLIELRMP